MHAVCTMSELHNGNGKRAGVGRTNLAPKLPPKRPASTLPPAAEVKENYVSFRSAEGRELRGPITHFSRQSATFEIYGETAALRASEALAEFRINLQEQAVYSGPATVASLIDHTGRTLPALSWRYSTTLPSVCTVRSRYGLPMS